MVKQLRILTYFLTLSCADLKWEKLPYFINKLNFLSISEPRLKNLSCPEQRNLLSNNPVLVARHFQYKYIFQINYTRWSIGKNKILCYTN